MIFLISNAISAPRAIAPKQIRAANTIRSEGLSANNCYYGMSGTTCYEYLISYLVNSVKRFLEAIASTAKLAKTFARRSRERKLFSGSKSKASRTTRCENSYESNFVIYSMPLDRWGCNLGKSLAIIKKILRSVSALSEGEPLPQLEASVHIHLKAKKPGRAIAGFWEDNSVNQRFRGTVAISFIATIPPMTSSPLVYPTGIWFPESLVSNFRKDFAVKAIALVGGAA